MRMLLVLLLLANLAFFGWSQWIDGGQRAPSTPAASAVPTLQLAREAAAARAAPGAAAGAVPSAAGARCVSVGPFTELAEVAKASTVMRTDGLLPRQRSREGAVWAGYWVSIDGLATAAAAEAVVERLRGAGVSDSYVLPGEAENLTVSLGLFSERQRALKRLDEVQALGLTAKVSSRTRSGTVYWIDVDLPANAPPLDPTRFQADGGRILRLVVEDCSAGAATVPVPDAGLPPGVPG